MSFCYPTGDLAALKSTLNEARSVLSEVVTKFFANQSGILVYSGSERIVIGQDPNFDYNWGSYNQTYTQTGVVNTGIYTLVTGVVVITPSEQQNDIKFFDDTLNGLRMKTNAQRLFLKSTNKADLEYIRNAKGIYYRGNEFEADSRVVSQHFFGDAYAYRLELKQVEEGGNYFMPDN